VSDAYFPYWPLFGITLRIGDLTLWPIREPELAEAARLVPDDVEFDPAQAMLEGLDLEANRRRLLVQGLYRHWGAWSPESWVLSFVVRRHGSIIGMQSVEGDGFARLRTVDSASWLIPSARGQGNGKAMRAAILTLAFDSLGANFAISSARSENAASLGASYSLGYKPNGLSVSDSPTGPCELTHVRLRRADWEAGEWARRCQVDGFAGCEPYFGLHP
jgi:RimJ/RimL family protein N-acetyltransferase